MSNRDRGWDFLNSSEFGFLKGDGQSQNYSDGGGYFHGDDGSEGYIYSDGSGYYHGADGSEGYIYSDGSGYYHGADGSDGYRYSDGSGYFHGADGSDGHRYSDGSGYFHGADGSDGQIYSDGSGYYNRADGSSISYSEGKAVDSDDSGIEALGYIIGAGLAGITIARNHVKAQKEEKRRQQREERLRQEAEERAREAKAKANREKRKKYIKAHKKGLFFSLLFAVILCIGCFMTLLDYIKTPIGISSSELIGNPLEYVETQLKENGFSNLQASAIYDIAIEELELDGIVSRVIINGNENFSASRRFFENAQIVIEYHKIPEIQVSISSKNAKNMTYQELEDILRKDGFINIRKEAVYDLITGWISKENEIDSISIDGVSKFDANTEFHPAAEVVITYHDYRKNKP